MKSTLKRVSWIGGAIVLALSFAYVAHANTIIEVTTTSDVSNASDNVTSFREAVAKVNELAQPATIHLPAGTYAVTQGTITVSAGDLIIQGDGANKTVIQGSSTVSTVLFFKNSPILIRDLTMDGVSKSVAINYSPSKAYDNGLSIEHCIFKNNKPAIQSSFHIKVSDSLFDRNYGAINSSGDLEVNRNTFSNNTSSAITYYSLDGGNLLIENSTFIGNTAPGSYGGAVRLAYGTAYSDDINTITIVNSTFSKNSTYSSYTGYEYGGGGAIAIQDICDCMPATKSVINLQNLTMVGNKSKYGGGIYVEYLPNVKVYLSNSILAENTAAEEGASCFGRINSYGYNLIPDVTYCSINNTINDYYGIEDEEVGLGTYRDDGTPGNGHYVLTADSLAIDNGGPFDDSTTNKDGKCYRPDQLGNIEFNGACDIGAVEFQGDGDDDGFALCLNGDITSYGCDQNDSDNSVWGKQEVRIDLTYAQVSGQQMQSITWRAHNYGTSDFTFVPTFYVDMPANQHPVKLGTAAPFTVKAGQEGKGTGTWYVPNAVLGTYYVWAEVEGRPVGTSYTSEDFLPVDTNNTTVSYKKTR